MLFSEVAKWDKEMRAEVGVSRPYSAAVYENIYIIDLAPPRVFLSQSCINHSRN